MTKILTIEHPIRVDNKILYAKINRMLAGTYKVNFWYGKEHLGDGTVMATSFNELIATTRTELEKFLQEIIEKT